MAMVFLEELEIFIHSVLHWVYCFLGFSFFFFVFGLKEIVVFGKTYFVPLPTANSFSVQIFNVIRHNVLPSNVQLIATNPMNAFASQVLFSLLLGLFITAPLLVYKIVVYLYPALLPREKRLVVWSLIPLILLFFSGSLFSYFFLIPTTFTVLYPFATVMGAASFFSLNEFIYYVFGLIVGVGMVFLLPLLMILLSYLRIIDAEFWRSTWRHALLFFLILSAIITPDGTGVTMTMLFLPLVALYFGGYFFASRLSGSS